MNLAKKPIICSLFILCLKEIKMLTNAFYERILAVIDENDLNMLSAAQSTDLMKKYKKLLNEKNGDLDEISYEDIVNVWSDCKIK